jgi:lauroyl/myristoyl acyltransferase
MIKKVRASLTGAAYIGAWRIVRWLPEKIAYQFFRYLADEIGKRNSDGARRLRANLHRVKPHLSEDELDALLKVSLRSYLRYWCDTFRFPDWSHEKIASTVEVTNEHLLTDAIKAGTGVIVALPHAGNWDHAGAYFCGKGIKLVTVAERLKPEALFRKFLAYRESMGMEVLPLDSRVIAILAKRLRQGHLVALVADRDLSRTGITVDFFDGKARMPAGPAILALNTGAPLLTAYVSYTYPGIHINFRMIEVTGTGSKEERIADLVQQCAHNFEDGIAAHPEDWHMLQRIWVDGDFTERLDA